MSIFSDVECDKQKGHLPLAKSRSCNNKHKVNFKGFCPIHKQIYMK